MYGGYGIHGDTVFTLTPVPSRLAASTDCEMPFKEVKHS